MKPETHRCEAYQFPHRIGGGECYGHDLADCPHPERVRDPFGTGDHWFVWVEHGCDNNKSRASR